MKTETNYETGHTFENPDSSDNWLEIKTELNRYFPNFNFPATKRELHDNFFKNPPGTANDASPLLNKLNLNNPANFIQEAVTGSPIVRTFWWGFHIEISSEGIQDLTDTIDPINTIISLIGSSAGPTAPYIPIAAAFIAGALGLIKKLDQGKGIYISMSWFAPGIFIPTGVAI